ncbi:MAG: hypothetical protein ACKV1O_15625 [Saprospiraceae bacterium]
MNLKTTTIIGTLMVTMLILSCCSKKELAVVILNEIGADSIAYYQRSDRNDIPLPPSAPWTNIDPSQLTTCQLRLWAYLRKIYPIQDRLYPEYRIYSIVNQPSVLGAFDNFYLEYERFFTTIYPENYLYSVAYSCPEEVNIDFVKQALGEPTCVGKNDRDKEISYFYFIKLRYRYGPCPFVRYNGEEFGSYCGAIQTQYCSTLRMIFSMETGYLKYIDFSV